MTVALLVMIACYSILAALLALLVGYPALRRSVYRAKLWNVRDQMWEDKQAGRLTDGSEIRAVIRWLDVQIEYADRMTLGNVVVAVLAIGRKWEYYDSDARPLNQSALEGLPASEQRVLRNRIDEVRRIGALHIRNSTVGGAFTYSILRGLLRPLRILVSRADQNTAWTAEKAEVGRVASVQSSARPDEPVWKFRPARHHRLSESV